MPQTISSHLMTGFIHGGEVQGWFISPYQKGWVTLVQAFPTDGVPNVRLQTRMNFWERNADGANSWWVLEVEVQNLDNNDVVYELWETFVIP